MPPAVTPIAAPGIPPTEPPIPPPTARPIKQKSFLPPLAHAVCPPGVPVQAVVRVDPRLRAGTPPLAAPPPGPAGSGSGVTAPAIAPQHHPYPFASLVPPPRAWGIGPSLFPLSQDLPLRGPVKAMGLRPG